MSAADAVPTPEERRRCGSPSEGATPAASTDEHLMKQLSDQLAEAECQKELARLDLEWEVERRHFLIVTNRTPPGEIPKRSTALAFLAVGAVFALGMALVILNSAVGLWLLLPFTPFVALTVFIIATGAQQYSRARGYHKALARYESRRNAIRLTPSRPATASAGSAPSPTADPLAVRRFADQLAETLYQAELARLDKEWEIERQKHYVTTRRGRRFLPDGQQALGTAAGGVVIGVFLVLTSTPAFFPYFGVLFALLGLGGGIHLYSLAKQYEQARSAYQSRRESLHPDQFRT